jgi:hypothetical protein
MPRKLCATTSAMLGMRNQCFSPIKLAFVPCSCEIFDGGATGKMVVVDLREVRS